MSSRLALLRFVFPAVFFGFLSCAHQAPAVEAKPAVVEPAKVAHPAGLFLYEVKTKDGAVSHLLGTIHLGFGFDEVLTPDARARFDRATEVMTEADVSAADPEQMLQAALLPPERSLHAILGAETWSKLVARVGAQIPQPMLDRLEPWLPTVVLSLEDLGKALAAMKPGAESRQMDLELAQQAKKAGKFLKHFETVQEQLAIFASIAVDEQVHELRRMLDEDGSAEARLLIESFTAGDEAALGKALFDDSELKASPGFYDRVLYDRNRKWLPVITKEVDEGGVFIAVGAGHLLGDRGIVADLKKAGYQVTRVE